MAMYRGNFDIDDYVSERVPLAHAAVTEVADGYEIAFSGHEHDEPRLVCILTGDARSGAIAFTSRDPGINRVWLRVVAEPGEHIWGGGEQMSYFDLRGRRFPLWTSEPGVGRDKSTEITFKAPAAAGTYPYLCTFPGHYAAGMKGTLVIK